MRTSRRSIQMPIQILVLALLVAGLQFQSAGHALAGSRKAEIRLFQFQPGTITVRAGTTVTWRNDDAIVHSVTTNGKTPAGQQFDSGFFTKGGSYSHRFTKPGTYRYFCRRHPSMTGKVVVRP
jgi:plastocyanin